MKTYWETPTSNLFNTANWSGGTIPGANDIVALTVAGNYTVTSNTNHTVLGVTTGSGATLSISLSTFTATEGTATGANAGTITLLDGSALRIGGIFDNTGLINLGGNTTSTKLAAMSNTTFEGGGRIQMTDDVFNFFGGAPTPSIITNVDNNISGAGTITVEIFNNDKKGVINATGTNNRLFINADVINSGLIEATGAAGLQFSGFGSIANKGGIIEAENGSTINVDGGNEIQGGTLKGNVDVGGNNGALLDGSSAGTLSNQGAVAIANGASLSLRGVINNTGSINLDGGATATSINLIETSTSATTVTLEGGGHVNLSDSSLNSLDVQGTTKVTLNNVNNTLSGAGTIGASGDLKLNNETLGIIKATGTNNPLILEGPVSNAGLIEATGAAGLTIDNQNAEGIANTASGVIEANTGSVVKLEAGIITGGTLKTSGTGAIQITASGSNFLVLDGSNELVHTNTMINIEGNVEISSGSGVARLEQSGIRATSWTVPAAPSRCWERANPRSLRVLAQSRCPAAPSSKVM